VWVVYVYVDVGPWVRVLVVRKWVQESGVCGVRKNVEGGGARYKYRAAGGKREAVTQTNAHGSRGKPRLQ
jgi:hypothetical protein